MNVFEGKISELVSDENLTIVSVEMKGSVFKAIVVESGNSAPYLKIGNEIKIAFKETEVILVTGKFEGISLRNRIQGKIKEVQKCKLLSRVQITSLIGEVVSIITTNAVEDLKLEAGKEVTAMIKTNEMILLHD
jgi:molybdate transport system regulatory protein